jgi:hypothetical protein
MKVSQDWLAKRVEELNEWLLANEKGIHFEYAAKKQKRDYYVNKLIEMEQSNLTKIKI